MSSPLQLVYPSVCAALALLAWLGPPWLWGTAKILGALWLLSLLARWLTEELCTQLGSPHVDPRGKAVLITGCDSGFGLELAVRLHARGLRVFAGCLLPESAGAQRLRALAAAAGDNTMHVLAPMDVTSDSQVNDAVQRVTELLSKGAKGDGGEDQQPEQPEQPKHSDEPPALWAVVANAGVISASELEWGSLEPTRRMIDVNALGVARTSRAFLPLVRRAKGRVVILTSLWSQFSIPLSVGYCMSKVAARFFADGLRREMKKFGVRVVSVEPNMYATNLTAEDLLVPGMDKQWAESSEQVRRDYGQAYFEGSRQQLRRGLAESRTQLHEVLDALEAAVLARRPRITYRPDGVLRGLQWSLLFLAPPPVMDAILNSFTQASASLLPGARGIARG